MQIEMSKDAVESILKGITIPSPPQLVADLQMAMMEPDPDLNRIADIICTDPGLAGGVLKAVNSPGFSLKQKITSIREAAMYLGFSTVAMIVNTLCLRSEMQSADLPKESVLFMNRFWSSCSDIATISTLVAEKARLLKYRDDAYMLGLFHNCGIVLMAQRFDDYLDVMHDSYGQSSERIVDIENRCYETNHAVVGYYIAKSWKLPQRVALAVAYHHSLTQLLNEPKRDEKALMLISILKVAEHISGFYKLIADQPNDPEWQRDGELIMEFLGINQDDVDDVASQVSELGLGGSDFYY